MNTTYNIFAEYETKGLDIFEMDAKLFEAINESSDGSGLGLGMRDHNFSRNTKEGAEMLAEQIGEFFSKNNISYTIVIGKASGRVRV